MEKIEGLSIGLDLDSTALNRGLTGVKDKLRTVNSEMKANMSAFDRGDQSLRKYETRLSGLNRKLEVQKEVTKQAKVEYEKMVREHGKGSKEADNAAKSYNNEVASLNNLERYTQRAREELHRLREEQRIAESGWTKFGQRLSDTGTRLTKISDSMKSTGRSMSMYLTAPIVGIGGLAVKVGMDFQESMSKVSAISGATGKDFESLEKQARDLGATTQFSASEAADGMQFLAMAGFKTNDILAAMPGMLDLAAAGALELGAAADITSNIMSGFGIEASKSGHVSDVLAKAASSANTDVSQLGEAMKYLAPSAKTLGWSMEESTAAVMAMSDAGIQGSLAGQAFGSSLGRLAKPTKAMKDVMDETGISFFNAEGKMKSMPDVIAEIENGTEGMTQKQKSATLTTLFGAEAYKHWAVLLDKSSDTLEENTSMLKKADGAAKDMATTMNDNAKGDIKILISSLQELSLQIYDILEPKIRGIIQTFTNLVVKVQELPQPFKMASIVMAALAAAIGPLLIVGGLFIGFLGSTTTGLGKLFPFIAKAGGLLKWLRLGFTALTGPVGLTIGILALLTAGIVVAYKKFETFRNAINKLKDVFISAFKIIVDYFKSKIEEMKAFWDSNGKQLLQAFQNIFNGILFVVKPIMSILEAIFKVTFNVILEIVKSVFGNIKGVIDGGLKVIMGLIQVFSGLFTGNFSKMWTGIKNIFSGSIQFIWNFMQLMFWGKMLKGILSLAKLMVNAFKGMWGSIKNVFSTVIKWIVDFVKNRFTSMKNTINTITTSIQNLISTIWNGILNFFKLVINSIVDLVKNRFTTLKKTIDTIFSEIRNLTKTIWNAIKDSIYTPIKNAVTDTIKRFTTLKSSISDIFGAIKKNIKGYVSDMVETVKGMPQRMSDGLKKTGGKIKEGVIFVSNKMVSGLGKGVNGVITGVNWVMGKLGVKKKNQLDPWKVPQYAQGTDGHPGGLAVVGDGKGSNAGQELIQTPDGQQYLSPAKSTLVNLPKGTHVLPASLTKQLIPHYAWGTDFGKKVKDTAVDVWQYASNPSKLLDLGLKSLGITAPSGDDTLGKIAKGGFTKVKNSAVDYVKEKMKGMFDFGGSAAPAGKGVERWRSVILKAAATMKESVTPAEVNGILAQIKRESTGNEKIVQSSAVWDVNTAAGNPARGLLQYIPQTFNAYKMKGHNNIYSGYDQLLAFFNNTTWRKDLPYGRRGWGPRGKRKYKNGTGLLGHIGGDAILGDGGKVEPFLMPNGLLGLSPDSSTLFPNLPKGSIVWPSIQNFLKEYAESQAATFTIPNNETYRTDAMKLLALAGKTVDKGNKRPGQLQNVGTSGSEGNNVLQKLLEATLEQTKVLLQLLNKDTDIILDGPSIAKGIHREVSKYQTQDKRISKRTIKGKVRK